jgi:hypothetical protein
MTAEIVDVASPQQRRHQDLSDPGEEAEGIDRFSAHTVQRCRRSAARQQGSMFPVSVRHLGDEALAAGTAPVRAGHVGLHPGLVGEDQTPWINFALALFPLLASTRHVGPVLLAGVQAHSRDQRKP